MKKEHLPKILAAVRQSCPDISAPELKEISSALSELISEDDKIPFEEFWAKYPKKDRRFAAMKAWKFLPSRQQNLAISYIDTYANKVYPYIQLAENYIHDRVWMDAEPMKPRTKMDLFAAES